VADAKRGCKSLPSRQSRGQRYERKGRPGQKGMRRLRRRMHNVGANRGTSQPAVLHCDSKPLVAQGDFVNAETMGYRHHCAFCRTHAYKWLCRVLIPRNVGVPVPKAQRHILHAHVPAGIRVQVVRDVSHSTHRDATPCGAHPVYTSAARQHSARLDFSRQEVQT
jgi:hypothetical protein